jgi:ATP-binding cassette, subfamily G (WHITE), member 2, SNQ2
MRYEILPADLIHFAECMLFQQFVRGVSGGERKRVSIAEMMTTRARVQAWDNSTRGLDASTALDFTRSLRVLTDVLGQTTFVSLSVPSLQIDLITVIR